MHAFRCTSTVWRDNDLCGCERSSFGMLSSAARLADAEECSEMQNVLSVPLYIGMCHYETTGNMCWHTHDTVSAMLSDH